MTDLLDDHSPEGKSLFSKENYPLALESPFNYMQHLLIVADIAQLMVQVKQICFKSFQANSKFSTLSLTNSGIPAISFINDENPEIIQQVLNGNYIIHFMFGLP